MKRFFLAAFLIASVSVFAQTKEIRKKVTLTANKPTTKTVVTNTNTTIKFKELKHNFGKITQGKPVSYIFKFTNNGSKPLIIESAVAGCGCTTPEYPKQPIAKGKEGTIKVTYNAANMGGFTKDVTVKFLNNDTPIVLNITGEVIAAEKPATK